jgi:hypothetical protein
MERFVWLLVVTGLVALGAAMACGDDDDDDNDNDDTGGVDDDDASPDDDDDNDDEPPYDAADCAPFVAACYETCHFELEIGGATLDADQALASCEGYEYTFWICGLACFEEYGEACVELYECLQECAAR